MDGMATKGSMSVLVASDPEARASAARLAAEVDPTSEFGATVRAVFEDVAEGKQVVILRPDREVTPAGAAELLGVTRQFVDRLLVDGVLAFRRLPGSKHRRIRLEDVVALVEERGRRRRGADAIRSALRSPD
jgi:excisionase family DNA binding protein